MNHEKIIMHFIDDLHNIKSQKKIPRFFLLKIVLFILHSFVTIIYSLCFPQFNQSSLSICYLFRVPNSLLIHLFSSRFAVDSTFRLLFTIYVNHMHTLIYRYPYFWWKVLPCTPISSDPVWWPATLDHCFWYEVQPGITGFLHVLCTANNQHMANMLWTHQ